MPPVKLTVVFGVVETVPGGTPHVLEATPVATKGAGKLSVTFTPVYGVLFGFCNVIISVVVPPGANVGGEKRFERPISRTFKRAVAAVEFERPCCVWSRPCGMVFV